MLLLSFPGSCKRHPGGSEYDGPDPQDVYFQVLKQGLGISFSSIPLPKVACYPAHVPECLCLSFGAAKSEMVFPKQLLAW